MGIYNPTAGAHTFGDKGSQVISQQESELNHRAIFSICNKERSSIFQ